MRYLILVSHGTFAPGLHNALGMMAGSDREDIRSTSLLDGMDVDTFRANFAELVGDITPEEARTHPRKNLITRALGSEERIRADLYEKELQPGDFLLLCSDGLSNIVTDQELLYEAIHGGEPSDCCQRLLHITLSRGAPDNVTAVLFQIV